MHYVAVTRWGAPLDAELPELAQMLGVTPYDCRLRLGGGLPVIVCLEKDAAAARARVQRLQARGHGAVCCATDVVPGAAERSEVREFERNEAGLLVTDSAGNRHELRYDDIQALVRASSITAEQNTVTTIEKKLNMGRALLSGGLIVHKKTEKVTRSASEAREQVLYVFLRSRLAPFVFRELQVRYQGLGELRTSTSLQNFLALIELLRAQAPSALYDQRFLTQKRKLDISLISGNEKTRKIESSNDDENALGAFMLLLAHVDGQL
jgi:hypothetical protein